MLAGGCWLADWSRRRGHHSVGSEGEKWWAGVCLGRGRRTGRQWVRGVGGREEDEGLEDTSESSVSNELHLDVS